MYLSIFLTNCLWVIFCLEISYRYKWSSRSTNRPTYWLNTRIGKFKRSSHCQLCHYVYYLWCTRETPVCIVHAVTTFKQKLAVISDPDVEWETTVWAPMGSNQCFATCTGFSRVAGLLFGGILGIYARNNDTWIDQQNLGHIWNNVKWMLNW